MVLIPKPLVDLLWLEYGIWFQLISILLLSYIRKEVWHVIRWYSSFLSIKRKTVYMVIILMFFAWVEKTGEENEGAVCQKF